MSLLESFEFSPAECPEILLLSPGTRLGPYEIVAPLRSGGMGDVYRARDTRLNRFVAIKVTQDRFSERFEREARAVAALNHPNICQLHDVGPNYLVMELVDGVPLGRVDGARKLLDLAVQIASGLAAAHEARIVHRDLKPDNVLVTRDGQVKILDFGLAKETASSGDADTSPTVAATQVGVIAGTAAYMSPEQARGLPVDARSDQFAFGLILHEMVTGVPAFRRETPAETMTAIMREEVPPLPETVPKPLRWTIERCLDKDPGERYDSTRDLYRELRRLRDRLSEEPGPTIARGVSRPPPRRLVTIGLAAAALAVGFAAAALWPGPPAASPPATPFATEADLQGMPRWSPKGDRLAYLAPVDGAVQVFVKSLGSATPTKITQETQPVRNPLWSADGTRIYYITGTRPNTQLRSIAVAGGTSERVLDGVMKADLSPDGRTLAVLVPDAQGAYRLAFSSPPGSPPRYDARVPLTDNALSEIQFDLSGTSLGLSNNSRFWSVPTDGTPAQEMRLGADALFTFRFGWSAVEGRIIGDSPVTSRDSTLWSTDLGAGSTRTIVTGTTQYAFPALSPDGRTLAFASGEIGFDIIEVPLTGAEPRGVIVTSRTETGPAWAPDGVHFAYATNRSGAQEIWLHNRLDGSERRIVSEEQLGGADFLFDCVVSPDGTRVAYRVHQGSKLAIWISPLSGDGPVQLWDDPAESPQRGPSWSPDGNWIAYYGSRDGRPAILKARVGAYAPAEFVAYAASTFPPRWSPRGRDWIVFRDGDTLRIVSPDGAQNHVISQRIWQTYGWSNDGTSVYGIAYTQDRRLFLGRVDVNTLEETKVADLGPIPAAFDFVDPLNEFAYRGFSLSPDGKSFLTSVFRVKTQIYLMKDFDRSVRLVDRWFGKR
jgi:Tol biopolymer transport system component/predicted Ser/Thr protein kinase